VLTWLALKEGVLEDRALEIESESDRERRRTGHIHHISAICCYKGNKKFLSFWHLL
jgi:hypothetical protein